MTKYTIAAMCLFVATPSLSQEVAVVWNAADRGSNVVLSADALVASGGTGNVFNLVRATVGRSSGKRCFELVYTSTDAYASIVSGIANGNALVSGFPGGSNNSAGVQWMHTPGTTQPYFAGVTRQSGFSVSGTAKAGDVLTTCIDFSVGAAWFARNGLWASGDPKTGSSPAVNGISGTWFPAVGAYNAANALRLVTAASMMRYMPSGFLSWSESGASPTPPPPATSGIPPDSPYPTQAPVWAKASEIFLNTGPARQPVGPGYFSTCWSATVACANVGPSPDVWHTVDLTIAPWNVPASAKWAFLEGILIITGANHAVGVGLGVVYRSPGDQSVTCAAPHYRAQAWADQVFPAGHRSNAAFWVPLVNGKFEMCWQRTSTDGAFPAYPDGPAMAFNTSIAAWAR